MLTKHKDVGPKKSVKSPLKNVFMPAEYLEIFFKGAPNFDILSSVFFSDRIILKHIENKKTLGKAGVCSSGNFLKKSGHFSTF